MNQRPHTKKLLNADDVQVRSRQTLKETLSFRLDGSPQMFVRRADGTTTGKPTWVAWYTVEMDGEESRIFDKPLTNKLERAYQDWKTDRAFKQL